MADDIQDSGSQTKALAEKASSFSGKTKTFVSDVVTEIRKTSWPTRQELIESTWVVIVMVLALGFFIFLCDWTLIKLQGWLIPRG